MRAWGWVAGMALLVSAPAGAGCAADGIHGPSLTLLREQEFAVSDQARASLLVTLPACLSDPDPGLRDGVAYEALRTWLRAGQVDVGQRRALRDRLYVLLLQEDASGFGPPFAALALSEVARTDRITPWMSREEYGAMVEHATAYVSSVRDYRGYDAAGGWRHGVAHGADWLLQLVLNGRMDRPQMDAVLQATATQIVPETPHAYVFGEPERLARPVLYAASRGMLDTEAWKHWFAGLPPRLGDAKPYADVAWLARRHDLMVFLMGLHVQAGQSEDPNVRALQPLVVETLKTVP